MEETYGGGPAFPVSTSNEHNGHQDVPNTWQFPGMTLRDYFAAKVVQGLLAGDLTPDIKCETVAKVSYVMADAMLAARESHERPHP